MRTKSAKNLAKFYEMESTDELYEYMYELFVNGNLYYLKDLYGRLNKEGRRGFIGYLFDEDRRDIDIRNILAELNLCT